MYVNVYCDIFIFFGVGIGWQKVRYVMIIRVIFVNRRNEFIYMQFVYL